jgi:hypothetical protein
MQGDEEQAVIPGDDELLDMPGLELRALAMKHGISCQAQAQADMRTRLSQIRDHGLIFCLECEDGVKRPLTNIYIAGLRYRSHLSASYLPTSQPEHLSLLYVCTYA